MAKTDKIIDKLNIRAANTADLPILVEFLAKLALHVAGSPPLPLKKEEQERLQDTLSAALIEKDKLIVVAELAEYGVIGMGYIYIWHNQDIWEQAIVQEFKSGVIDDIWVEPDFRKLGVFSALLSELVDFSESQGVQELILEYSVTNKEAEATWTKLGFKTTGVRAAASIPTVREKLTKNH